MARYVRRRVTIVFSLGLVLSLLLVPILVVNAGQYWHSSHGPAGGNVQALVVNAAGELYAGTSLGWVFKGTFSGGSLRWTLKNSGIARDHRNIQCLALDASDYVYAGTSSGGVYQSTDGGDHWSQISTGGFNQVVYTLLVHSGSLYAGTAGGVYTNTLPTPGSWTKVGARSLHTQSLVRANSTFYAGCEYDFTNWGVYRWTGPDWTAMQDGLPNQASVYAMVADGSTLYASAEDKDNSQGYGVYKCDTTAITPTWQVLVGSSALPDGEAEKVRALTMHNGLLYAGTENGVYSWSGSGWVARNTDSVVEAGQTNSNAHRIRALLSTSAGPLYAGTPGRGIFRTADVGNWGDNWSTANGTPTDYLLSAHVVRAVAINPAYDWRIYAGTEGGGTQRSYNGGVNWERRSGIIQDRDVFALAVTHPSGVPVYAGTNDGIYTTTNGITWTLASNGLTTPQSLYVRALAIDPISGTIVYAGTGSGVYKTTNSGVQWVYKRVAPAGVTNDYRIMALAIDPITPTLVYAGTEQNGVYRSTNAGQNWTEFNDDLPTGDAQRINALTVDTEHTVFAGTDDGIYKRAIISDTWQGDWVRGQPVYALIVNPITPTIVLAGTRNYGVLFYGDDPSDTWNTLNERLVNYHVYSLAIDDYVTQTLHAGTAGSGVFDFTWGPPPPPPPEMGINKTDGRTEVSLGQLITYTLQYANYGDEEATGIVITDVIPTYTVFVYSDRQFSTKDGRTYTTTIGAVARESGASALFVVRVLTDPVHAPSKLINYASIRDDGRHGPDPYEDNNYAQDVNLLSWVDLKVNKSNGTSQVTQGGVVTYTIAYTNTGRSSAANVVLTEVFTGAAEYVDTGVGWTQVNTNTYQLNVTGTLTGGGGAGSTTFTVRVDEDAEGTLFNRVEIDYDGAHGPDLTPSDNIAWDEDPISTFPPDLAVAKTDGAYYVTAGDILTYTITYTNAGAGIARGIVITETIPDHTSIQNGADWHLVSGRTYTCTASDLPAGQAAAVSITVRLNETASPGPITNIVSIRAVGEVDFTGNTATDTDWVVVPNLEVAKTDGRSVVGAGDILTYTISYTNTGAGKAQRIVITETIPDHTSIQNGAAWHLVSGQTYTRTVSDLPIGQTAAVQITVQVNDTAGAASITNTVSIRALGEGDFSRNTAIDADLVSVPDLTVTKTDNTDYVERGQTITYTIAYTNTGPVTARGIVVTETIPNNTTIQNGAAWSLVSGRTYRRTVPDLPASQVASVNISVQVDPGASAGFITNTVSIRALGEKNFTSNTATDTDWVLEHAPDLLITSFSDGVTAATLCQPLTYTLRYANTGDMNATGVAITATFPASMTCSNCVAAGWTVLGGNRYRRTIGTVAISGSGEAILSARIANPSVGLMAAPVPRADMSSAIVDPHWPDTYPVQVVIGCAQPEDQSNNTAIDTDALLRPDLIVIEISTSPPPLVQYQPATIYMTVKNIGNAGTYLPNNCCIGFYNDLYVDLGHAPGGGEYSNVGKSQWWGSLPAGSAQVIPFTYTFTTTGTHTLYAQINPDRYSTIPEITFTNNTSGPFPVTVIPSPDGCCTIYLPLVMKSYTQ